MTFQDLEKQANQILDYLEEHPDLKDTNAALYISLYNACINLQRAVDCMMEPIFIQKV